MTVDEMISDAKLEMVRTWLTKHGYTGLACSDAPCGCEVNKIAPFCGQNYMGECKPGYVTWCKDCSKQNTDDCDFPESDYCVSLKKEE